MTFTRSVLVSLAIVIAVTAVGCTEPTSSARPSSSLLEVEFTPRATEPDPAATDEPTEEPTFVAIPVGWDDGFCAIFADVAVAQELVIDVERAIDEENAKDAKGLARDLRDITADGVGLMEGLPEWEDAADATAAISSLLEMYGKAATEYLAFFNEETANLRRARSVRRQISRATPAANDAFAELETLGIVCDDQALVIEEFKP